jgi:hypothetical protein
MEINPWTESDDEDHALVITDFNLMFRLLFNPSIVIDKNNPRLLRYNEIEQDFRAKLAEGDETHDIVRSCGELPLKEVIKLVSIIRKKHKIQNNLFYSNKLNQKSTGV